MNKLVVACLASLIASTAAASPASRVNQIDAAVTAVVNRTDRLPADAAAIEKLAADLITIHAQAKAALTPDLSVVGLYRNVVADVAKLPALSAAVRASWPCTDGARALREATKQERVSSTAELDRVDAACSAFEAAARGTRLQALAARAERDSRARRNAVAALESRLAQLAKQKEVDAKRAAEQAATVMGRFPELTLADSLDQRKIAEAFARAPAEMIFTEGKPYSMVVQPIESFGPCQSGDDKKIAASWYHNGEASSLEIRDGADHSMAGVPLLIWQRTGTLATLVSLDGLRYATADVTTLINTVPAKASWPAVPRLVCLDDEMVEALAKANAIDAAIAAKAETARAAVGACISRVWRSGERDFEANDTANITASTRANRYSALLDRYTNKVERSCARQKTAYEATMLAAMKAFAAPRAATLSAATAALAATSAAVASK
jgi:hypothetical protein